MYLLALTGYSQKGVGESEGLSRQGQTPEFFEFLGTLEKIEIGPCEHTTGKSVSGTHLMIRTMDKEMLNIHLGPTADMSKIVEGITVGDEIGVKVFRTEKLPADSYIDKELTIKGQTIVLRDETLKPVWSSGSGKGKGKNK